MITQDLVLTEHYAPPVVKAKIQDLALFGRSPAFDRPVHVGRPNIGDRTRFQERVNDILDRRWLTNSGTYVKEFEHRIADLIGVKHCVAMCNATVALEIAIRALNLTGEVIVPSFTFVATAHALQWQEITPVFCDIEPHTCNADPNKIEQMITPRTTGIIGVHVFGRPCNIDALAAIAKRHNLKLLFDSAHALACSYKGGMIGGFGDAEVFSFHATKFLNTLEGGAVVTDNDELAAKLRLMKNFGFTEYDQVDYVGTNGKMNEVSAAMGLTNLECLNDFIAVNQRNYRQYQAELAGLDGVSLLVFDERELCNFQYVVLDMDRAVTGLTRDQLVDILHAENVLARRYFYPGCHRMEPYRSYFPHARLLLPETEKATERLLVLPTGTGAGEDDIAHICQIIRLSVEHGAEISAAIRAGKASSSAAV